MGFAAELVDAAIDVHQSDEKKVRALAVLPCSVSVGHAPHVVAHGHTRLHAGVTQQNLVVW